MSTKRTLAERAEQIRTILGDPLYRYQQTTSLDAPASDDDPDGATLWDGPAIHDNSATSMWDEAYAVAVDHQGNAVVAGVID